MVSGEVNSNSVVGALSWTIHDGPSDANHRIAYLGLMRVTPAFQASLPSFLTQILTNFLLQMHLIFRKIFSVFEAEFLLTDTRFSRRQTPTGRFFVNSSKI